jgi:GTP-binding protein HflX
MIDENFSFKNVNTAIAVSLKLPNDSLNDTNSSLNELILLAKTLGIKVKKYFIQNKRQPQPNYYIGTGKLDEIKEYLKENNVDAVLFDNELSGIQARNLEKYLGKIIFGRTEIILNIFSKRAKTSESKLQVQLASLEYLMPRLRNRWDHFSRVEGGIGLRGGEGEKQLELDRRMIKDHINRIKKKIKKIDIQMKNRRKKRIKQNIISIVGYTNAGKSTLFNKLTKSEQFTENMLFATLDSTTRKFYLNDKLTVLLSDTVGFINKLPHNLVASFKSTLDEIPSSKLLLHVIDVSSQSINTNINSVKNILDEIGASDIPCIRVFNKNDLLKNGIKDIIIEPDKNDIYISALTNQGIEELKQKIINFFSV